MRVTIKDVAAEVGCSPSLVSFYLGHPATTRVAEATKKRIDQAVRKLNYRRNLLASILKSGHSNVVGILVDSEANNPIRRLLTCLEREADRRHCRLQLGLFHDNLESIYESYMILKQYGTCGIICLSHDYPYFNEKLVERFAEMNDLVFFDAPERTGHPCIIPDMEDGIRHAIVYLREKGRKRIALCIPGKCPEWNSRTRRIKTFRQVFGDNALICQISHDMSLRDAMMTELLPFVVEHRIDALLMSNDRFAMCGMQLLISKGFRIPEDLAVIGFDNDPCGMEATPPLSSIAWNAPFIARKLFGMLDEQLSAQKNIGTIRVPVDLILRHSS